MENTPCSRPSIPSAMARPAGTEQRGTIVQSFLEDSNVSVVEEMVAMILGQRAYGFASASEIYFGKPLKDITIAEAAMLDVVRQPIDLLVVGEHLIFELRRSHEPALTRILDERIFIGPPAEGVLVDVLLLVIKQPPLFQVAADVLVAILYPAALIIGRLVSELAIGADGADQLRPVHAFDLAGSGFLPPPGAAAGAQRGRRPARDQGRRPPLPRRGGDAGARAGSASRISAAGRNAHPAGHTVHG